MCKQQSFMKAKSTYMNYEYYAKHNKTVITETTYTNNKIHLRPSLTRRSKAVENFLLRI